MLQLAKNLLQLLTTNTCSSRVLLIRLLMFVEFKSSPVTRENSHRTGKLERESERERAKVCIPHARWSENSFILILLAAFLVRLAKGHDNQRVLLLAPRVHSLFIVVSHFIFCLWFCYGLEGGVPKCLPVFVMSGWSCKIRSCRFSRASRTAGTEMSWNVCVCACTWGAITDKKKRGTWRRTGGVFAATTMDYILTTIHCLTSKRTQLS